MKYFYYFPSSSCQTTSFLFIWQCFGEKLWRSVLKTCVSAECSVLHKVTDWLRRLLLRQLHILLFFFFFKARLHTTRTEAVLLVYVWTKSIAVRGSAVTASPMSDAHCFTCLKSTIQILHICFLCGLQIRNESDFLHLRVVSMQILQVQHVLLLSSSNSTFCQTSRSYLTSTFLILL